MAVKLIFMLQKLNSKNFFNLKSSKYIRNINFDTNTTINDFLSGISRDWIFKINSLDQYDFVISDNLIEILEIRKDAWIIASFFGTKQSVKSHWVTKKKIRNNVKKITQR